MFGALPFVAMRQQQHQITRFLPLRFRTGKKLVELDIEYASKEQRKGNIYRAVGTRVEQSLEACFVEYGTDRHGFLPCLHP